MGVERGASQNAAPRGPKNGPSDEEREDVLRQLKAQLVAQDSEEIEPLRKAIEEAKFIGIEEDDSVAEAAVLLRKLQERHHPLTFTDIPRQDMEKLHAMSSRDEIAKSLVERMGLQKAGGSFQSDILVEYHYHNFAFCQRNRFCPEKSSTVMSIFKTLHQRSIIDEKLPIEKARALLEGLLERHSRQLPPYRVGVFSPAECDSLRQFAEVGFFRHYEMYAFAYVSRHDLRVRATDRLLAPCVPETVSFLAEHECDPHEVAELQHLFVDTAAEAAAAAALSSHAAKNETPEPGDGDGANAMQEAMDHDDISAAIHEAMGGHLGSLDAKLELPF